MWEGEKSARTGLWSRPHRAEGSSQHTSARSRNLTGVTLSFHFLCANQTNSLFLFLLFVAISHLNDSICNSHTYHGLLTVY